MYTTNKPANISAYIGIAGAVVMAASDILLLGVPQAGWEGDLSSFSSLEHVAMWRIQIGPLIGWIASFFICFGFWHIKQMFSFLNPRLSMIMFIALSSFMVFGGGFHAGYYFAGRAIHESNITLYSYSISQLAVMSYAAIPGLVIGTGIYIYMLKFVPNDFPGWMWLTNPIVLQGAFLGLFFIIPAPLGGYLKPAFVNVASLVFFIIHMLVAQKKIPGIARDFSTNQ